MPPLPKCTRRTRPRNLRASVGAVLAAIGLALLAPAAMQAQLKEGTEKWYLERGRSNMEIKNYKAAIEAYQKVTKLNPDNREAMKQLGVAYEKQGLTTDAIKQYDRYLERFHDDAEIAFKQADYLGWSRFAYRREDAIKYYRMGLAVRDDPDRRHKLAQLLARDKKQINEALTEYRALLKAKPNNAEIRNEYRKLLVWDDKNLDEAIQEYRKYADEKKGDFEVDHTLATLLARKNPKSEEVVRRYGDLVKRKPNDEKLRREYADLLSGSAGSGAAGSKQNSEAIAQYKKLVEKDPSPEMRHKYARLLASDRANLNEAVEQYKILLKAQPNNAQWREEYRKLLLWDDRHLNESIEEQRRVVAAKPSDLDQKRTLAQLLVKQNPSSQEALKLEEEVVRSRPSDLALRLEYADMLAANDERRFDAIAEYRTVLERDPRPETRHKLARLLASDRAQIDEAVQQYRTLVQSDPGNPEYRAEYRDLLLWDERYRPDAIQELRRVVSERPGDTEAQHALAKMLAAEDPTSQEALTVYADVLKKQPTNNAVRLEYADLLASNAQRRNDAIEQYRTILKGDPKPATRRKLARLLASDRAHVDEAIAQYRELIKAQPKDKPEDPELRAEYRKALLWDEKNTKEAIAEYRRYAKEKPGDFEVAHTLARLLARDDPRSDEAARLYRGLLEARPDDQTLRVEYLGLIAADPKRRNEAIGEYRKLLAADPRPETREALADALSGEKAGRAEAQQQYEALLKEQPDNIGVRLKLAGLLAGERETTPDAIEHYENVIEREPKNGPAHAGLAAGYAAQHKRDQALREANLAVRYGASESDLFELRKDLMRGRDPRLQGFVRGVVQRGRTKSELEGVQGGGAGRLNAGGETGTFVTLRAEGGAEKYSGKVRTDDQLDYEDDDTGGGFARVDTDFHGENNEFGLGLGYHRIGERSIPGRVEYSHLGESWKVGLGAERSLRYDSYVALVGDTINGRKIGSARENRLRFFTRYQGERGTFHLEPYGGFVDAKATSINAFGGGRMDMRYRIFDGDHVEVSPMLAAEGYYYDYDAFGVDLLEGSPRPGGYFSPQGFGSVEPGLALSIRMGESAFLDIEGGPAVQASHQNGESWDVGAGGQGKLEWVLFLHPSVYWGIGAEVKSLGAAYTRFGASTRLAFEF